MSFNLPLWCKSTSAFRNTYAWLPGLLPPMHTWPSWWTGPATDFFFMYKAFSHRIPAKQHVIIIHFGADALDLYFALEIRDDTTSHVIPIVQYVAIMCVIKLCSWLSIAVVKDEYMLWFYLYFYIQLNMKPWFLSEPLPIVHGAISPFLHGLLHFK
jgi:hypothetical protein